MNKYNLLLIILFIIIINYLYCDNDDYIKENFNDCAFTGLSKRVRLYDNIYYNNPKKCLEPGKYTMFNLNYYLLRPSSIEIPKNYKVILYSDDKFKNKIDTLTTSKSMYNFSKVKSIEVIAQK